MEINLNSEILNSLVLNDEDLSQFVKRIDVIKLEKSRKQPKNSAKTQMPCFHNIDREIEDLRVRNTRFEKSIDKELRKLNITNYEGRFSLTGSNLRPREIQKHPKSSLSTGYSPGPFSLNLRRSSDTNDTSNDESLFTKVQRKRYNFRRESAGGSTKKIRAQTSNRRAYSPTVCIVSNSPRMDLNQYVKSIPMHQDPRYSFVKNSDGKRSPSRNIVSRSSRLDKIETIMSRCSLVEKAPVNHLSDLRRHLRVALEGMNEVKHCMSTIERAGDTSADQDSLEEVKNIQRREQHLEHWMKGHSLDMKEQNTAMSEFIHHLGKPKQLTWRFPGPAFPKKTEKLLNSLPTQRYGT